MIVAGTLAWAWWEVGLDWWPMAARGDVIFLVGLLLLTPWVTRALGHRDARRVSALRGAGLSLTVVLAVALATALASWFNDPHPVFQGTLPVAHTDTPTDRSGIPPGEWHAYGRTEFGQRYSPLAQITPQNVAQLETAWTYRTGDERGRLGDPEETTFEATPLKIGDRLFLCTPHQLVIALDATTGAQIWRYDPQILNKLALQGWRGRS